MKLKNRLEMLAFDLILKFDEVVFGKILLRYSDFADMKSLRFRQMNWVDKYFYQPLLNKDIDLFYEAFCVDYRCNCRLKYVVKGK